MGKKGKPKAKSQPKVQQQQPLPRNLDTEPCDLPQSCLHYTYEGTIYLVKNLRDILASKCAGKCQLCLKDTLAMKEDVNNLKNIGKQQQGSKKKNKGSSAAKVIHIWVCLTCNEHFCVAVDIKASSHARQHAKLTKHWWAANHSDPSSIYCFKCDREYPVQGDSLFDKKVETPSSDSRFRIQGLQSLGSETCFNAILQNLLSLKLLRKDMLLHLEFPRDAPLCIALRELFVRTSWSKKARGELDQKKLLSQICSIYPDFRSSHMLDCEKAFRYLLDGLRIEEKKAWTGVPTAANSAIFDSVFGGQCSITVSCSNCSDTVTHKDFFYLSLLVPSGRGSGVVQPVNPQAAAGTNDDVDGVSLENCLKLYTDPETWICEKCDNTKGPKIEEEVTGGCKKGQDNEDKHKDHKMMVSDASTRRVLIRIPPPILTLHLKRSSKDCHDQSRHSNGRVNYNENLDIGPFMDPRSGVDGHYHLAGAVLHTETLTGGRYIANVKANVVSYIASAKADTPNVQGTPLRWFTAKDEQVRTITFKSFEGEARLLFYQKVTQDNLDIEDTQVVETHPELKVKTPLPLAFETVEGSHSMRTHGNVLRGLPNLGNSCFFNAMVQILLALDPLRCKMLQPDVWRGPISSPLKQLFLDTSSLNSAQGLLNARNLFKRARAVCSGFKIGSQEDSHEALTRFLDALHEEEAGVQKLSKDIPIDHLPTAINSIFRGSLVNITTGVECAHRSTKVDSFLDIQLPIPSGRCPSIEDCWALYTEQTEMDEKWDCFDCAREQVEPVRDAYDNPIAVKRSGIRKLLIGRAPQVLLVSLKRYAYSKTSGFKKLEVNVRFKEMLDMQPFLKERSVEINTMYRLVGVVQHIGDMGQGHYVAFVRANGMGSQMYHINDQKSWFFVSDENTREASIDEVLGCEAYILLYEKCSTNACQSSGDLTCESSQFADTNAEPYSSDMPTVEESQAADADMQLQTDASANDLLHSLLNGVRPWEFQKRHNQNRDRRNEILMDNDLLGQKVGKFLELFTLHGDKSPFYQCELVMMCERGSGSRELNVHYSHLLSVSKQLAMDVCNQYESLMMNLKETAIMFVKTVLALPLNLTDAGRERMMQLASTEKVDASLQLKFLEMPKLHLLLKDCLQPPLTERMDVFGHWMGPIRTPLPEKCALVQRLLAYMIDNHRAGLSWDGDFDTGDVDVYDDRIFIAKEPKSFPIHPKISLLMVRAMGKDFFRIAESVLKKFISDDKASIPYLQTFIKMLSKMEEYDTWWSDEAQAEALQELIENFPFLKPAMARSNLWSGIFSACRSHDVGDPEAKFKELLAAKTCMDVEDQYAGWLDGAWYLLNRMLRCVFQYKDPKPDPAAVPVAEPAAESAVEAVEETGAEPAAESAVEAVEEPAEVEDPSFAQYYEQDYTFLMEYMRHLFHHGSGYTFKYRPYWERGMGPRKQLMKSFDEAEVLAAIHVEGFAVDALLELLKHSAITGLLVAVWECYKNCNYPFRPRRHRR